MLHNGQAVTYADFESSHDNGILSVFGAIDINARPSTIWAIMTKCPRNFDIIKALVKCEVVEQDEKGLWDIRQQAFKVGVFLPYAKTYFRSEYSLNKTIKIQRIGGDLKVQDAVWRLEPQNDKITRVTYQAQIKSRLPIPRNFIKRATKQDTPEILLALKHHAEVDERSSVMQQTTSHSDP